MSATMTNTKPAGLRTRPWLPHTWLFGFLLLAGFCFWKGAGGPTAETVPTEIAQAPVTQYETKAIRDIKLLDWVLADNPETAGHLENDFGEVNADDWRLVHLRMYKGNGETLDIELARPWWWLDEVHADISETIFLEMEEMGAVGDAEVLDITDCPPIAPRPTLRHHLVTARFIHSSGDFLNLSVEGAEEPIGVTANHPIWSEDKQAFVRADELDPGERLRLADGRTAQVVSSTRRPGTEAAYNLEVDGEHVYYVSSLGVLSHNLYKDANGRWHRNNGDFASRLGRPRAPSMHGNSRASTRTTYLYKLMDKDGRFLKWGISQDKTLVSRYGRSFLSDKDFKIVSQGSRSSMLDLERSLVESMPGPWNHEPWVPK